jgi:glycosyltransferase involved in cell wall biosynthesis
VYPPVNTDFYHPDNTTPGSHLLVVSALVPYKRLELAIEAATHAPGHVYESSATVRIARGSKRLAGPTVEFLGRLSDDQVREQYREAAAVILPARKTSASSLVEAHGLRQAGDRTRTWWGARNSHRRRNRRARTATTSAAFAAAFDRIASLRFDSGQIRRHAEQFSTGHYLQRMQTAVDETMAAPAGTDW